MEKICNIQVFANNYYNEKCLPKEILKLGLFTLQTKKDRKLNSKNSENIIFSINNNEYIFKYRNKSYKFTVFSDNKLQLEDIKNLRSSNRMKKQLLRTLKLACSLKLIHPRVVIGNSIFDVFDVLILFKENGQDKVIDYARNIVMTKSEYYELFEFQELNVVDKVDLYNIYYIIDKLDDYEHIFEYLLFSKEIFNDLSKKSYFKFLNKKYNSCGLNLRNFILLGNNSENLFFQEEDFCKMKYSKLIKELDSFTINPKNFTKHITYDIAKKKYKLQDKKFGEFNFDLLSDIVINSEIKNILLSEERYGECHKNSIIIANSLDEEKKKKAYVVSGNFKENENDSFSHSWVELEESNLVIDFNHNIIMNKDKYYQLFEIRVISKTSINDIMECIIPFVVEEAGLSLHPSEINFFGKEIYNDLKKNEFIFKRKIS